MAGAHGAHLGAGEQVRIAQHGCDTLAVRCHSHASGAELPPSTLLEECRVQGII